MKKIYKILIVLAVFVLVVSAAGVYIVSRVFDSMFESMLLADLELVEGEELMLEEDSPEKTEGHPQEHSGGNNGDTVDQDTGDKDRTSSQDPIGGKDRGEPTGDRSDGGSGSGGATSSTKSTGNNQNSSSSSATRVTASTIKEVQSKVAFGDKAKALSIAARSLSGSEIGEIRGMLSGGVTSAEQGRIKSILSKSLSKEEKTEIKSLYYKYVHLLE